MQLLKNKKFLYPLIAVCLVVAVKMAWDRRPCNYPGCYGPFEIVIKAENGERVEDVIVGLSHITAGMFEGQTHTYKEVRLGNSDEVIRFPRGFVYSSRKEELRLEYYVLHPDYRPNDIDLKFPNRQGVISLGEKIISHGEDRHDRSIAKEIEEYRKEGYSEEEIEKKLEGRRKFSPEDRSYIDYFSKAVRIGREDIVGRHLEKYLRQEIDYRASINKPEKYSFEDLYQLHLDAIYKRAER